MAGEVTPDEWLHPDIDTGWAVKFCEGSGMLESLRDPAGRRVLRGADGDWIGPQRLWRKW